MSDDMVRCSACGTPHGSIEDATVCCEKDKPGVVGRRKGVKAWDAVEIAKREGCEFCLENIAAALLKGRKTVTLNEYGHVKGADE